MLDINDLADALGLSKPQVRRRLRALDGIINNHLSRGQNQKVLVDSGGLEILKRLETYRQEGVTTDQAVDRINEELTNSGSVKHSQTTDNTELLERQIRQLQSEVGYLRKQLDRKDQQIQQLLPGPNGKGIIRRIWDRIW